jgi:Na+/H+ antiporter NhaC
MGRGPLTKRIQAFLQGIGDLTIITMCIVFLLAGAFSSVMDAIGAVDATVNAGIALIPGWMLLPGLFVISALISTAMGTSNGTVAAVVPVAVGVSEATGLNLPLAVGTVIGGAMFGDNLSIISDTTIAATRTQECSMRDKFFANVWIALLAAGATVVLLLALGTNASAPEAAVSSPWLVIPYLLVLGLAVAGVNVIVVLASGVLLAGVAGFAAPDGYSVAAFAADIYRGFESVFEIMLLAMFIGGLSVLIKRQGGLAWLTQTITRLSNRLRTDARRTGEFSMAALVSLNDILTANNVVSILLAGDVARDLAADRGISRARTASVLDIFACVTQGSLPYGAQHLLGASLAGLSPLAVAGTVHYCWILGLVAIGFILWKPAAPLNEPA